MRKRDIAFGLGLMMMAISLSACSGSKKNPAATEGPTVVEATETADATGQNPGADEDASQKGPGAVNDASGNGLVELVEAGGEETEGAACEDTSRLTLLQLLGRIDEGLTGGDHIVDDKYILTLYVCAEELMGHDRVTAVDYL